MTNVENIVIEHLKGFRAGQDRIEAKLSEIGTRLTSLETAVLKSRSDNLGTQEDVYRQQTVLDGSANDWIGWNADWNSRPE